MKQVVAVGQLFILAKNAFITLLVLKISPFIVSLYLLYKKSFYLSKDVIKRPFTDKKNEKPSDRDATVSVNYFPSCQCNYSCSFCFHTDTSSYMLPIDKAKEGLRILREARIKKLSIAGGEPFLHPKFLSKILRYSKDNIYVDSVSIFLQKHAQWLDILAIPCDSFDPETNRKIGRGEDDGKNMLLLNAYNWDEDMTSQISQLAPFRWKVFQCLIVEGEHEDETRKRDARKFLVTEEQWQTFCQRHKHLECYIPEDNNTIASSYLFLDENMCFLDKGEGEMKRSRSILDVGVKQAMKEVGWDKTSFMERGGIYDWSREQENSGGCGSGNRKELAW
ncbi:radical SAM enzyme [Massarina eburnea CBS 473.64]|uniref:Radical SAM enzyme n=1 Tax=Massarina eburnea CBS 473.64 TaxID=1395130 RepID=A0A6A6SGJ4_9PLEO|nr:radical SAM enzyme [Massarina eburnea CBS 473.64]